MRLNWSKYPNFKEKEFACSHTGQCHMDKDFMDRLQALRTECGFPFKINSGYRHPTHPIEAAKLLPGEHCSGMAVDIGCSGAQAYEIIRLAPKHGFIRIGVSQNEKTRFIHLGTSTGYPHPRVWSY